MKKKHRDIVVAGVTYGWIATGFNQVKIYKTKNDFVQYEIPDYLDITPKIVAALIKDPVDAMLWITAESCPFCGTAISKATGSLEDKFFVCMHETDCWLLPAVSSNLISKSEIGAWNKRH